MFKKGSVVKRWVLSVLLFFIIMMVLAIPYFDWGLINDDYGFIHFSQIKSLKDLLKFFGPHDIGDAFNPSNYQQKVQTFFSAFYRPMQFVLFGLETFFLGINPYRFLLLITVFHAGIAVALFRIFTYFFDDMLSFFGALFFGLHPLLLHWVGVFTCQIYIVDLIYLLLAVGLLKKYLVSKNILFYLMSCLVATVSIFAKETLIVMPVWVAIAGFMWYYHQAQETFSWWHFLNGCYLSLGYGVGGLLYLLCRALVFPMSTGAESGGAANILKNFLVRQQERLGDFISYACDYCYVGLIPPGNQVIKGTLVVVVALLLVWPFIATKKKMYLGFLIFSMLIFTWPAVLLYYQPRYLYIGLPFFLFIILYSVNYYLQQFQFLRPCAFSLLFVLASINAAGFMHKQRKKEIVLHTIFTAFQELSDNDNVKNAQSLCFVGLPMHWFGSGNAQAVRLLGGNKKIPVFYDINNFLYKREAFYDIKKHCLNVSRSRNEVQLTSGDPRELIFPRHLVEHSTLGKIFVYAKNVKDEPVNLSIKLNEKIMDHDPLLISWDYAEQQFTILKFPQNH